MWVSRTMWARLNEDLHHRVAAEAGLVHRIEQLRAGVEQLRGDLEGFKKAIRRRGVKRTPKKTRRRT